MAAEYLLDVLGDKPVLALPTQRRAPQRAAAAAAAQDAAARTRSPSVAGYKPSDAEAAIDITRRRQMRVAEKEKEKNSALPGEMRRRLASVLEREFSKKASYSPGRSQIAELQLRDAYQ